MSGKKKKSWARKKDEWKKSLAGGFADPRPTTETHGWVSPAVGLDELVPDVLETAALDDDDDGGFDPNNDCGRFAITETLKDLRISAVQHLGLFFGFFLMGLLRFEFGFLVFNMASATFRVIKCSDFRMKKILKRVNLPL
jgi:hypothetical protein